MMIERYSEEGIPVIANIRVTRVAAFARNARGRYVLTNDISPENMTIVHERGYTNGDRVVIYQHGENMWSQRIAPGSDPMNVPAVQTMIDNAVTEMGASVPTPKPLVVQTLADQSFRYGDLVPGDVLRHEYRDGGNGVFTDMSVFRVRPADPLRVENGELPQVTVSCLRAFVRVDEEISSGYLGYEEVHLTKTVNEKCNYVVVRRANSITYPKSK